MSQPVIVVVDDEPFIVDMIRTFLQLKGYTVHGVHTGQEGLILTQVERPDALLLDLMLPDIEGFEVCRRLRAMPELARLPILIISARYDPESRKRAERAGATAYLIKPLKMPQLVAELEKALAGVERAPASAPDSRPSAGDSISDE